MLPTDLSPASELPELSYGSVWLVGAGDGDPCHLSPFTVHALGSADAVIHDPEIPQEILDSVMLRRYWEAAAPDQAVERVVKLAQEGWRVVYLVKGSAAEEAGECAARLAEHGIPLRLPSNIGEAIGGETTIKLLLVRQPVPVWGSQAGTAVTLIAARQPQPSGSALHEPPSDFSMSGLAG